MTQTQDVFVLSDAAGETAQRVARAAFSQFPTLDVNYTKFPFVKNDAQLENILKLAKEKNAVLIHTLVHKETIHTVEDYCQTHDIL